MIEKLNLGCGFRKQTGYLNVDCYPECEPELVLNLATTKWPWPDSSINTVLFEYSLEQMGASITEFCHVLQELYRVCASGAQVKILALHPRHDQFVNNPLCVHAVTPELFQSLSRKNNEMQVLGSSVLTMLAYKLSVDFSLVEHRYLLSPEFESAVAQGDQEAHLRRRMNLENNICQSIEMRVAVNKRPVHPHAWGV